ncbi:MAG: amidohydrolase family protein [Candidatus Altiarchaeota archaeon]|nr:amidohydrolase family protein [Candidatus Altiarchaeota archaeon]
MVVGKKFDFVVKNARVSSVVCDIGIDDGVISKVGSGLSGSKDVDAKGMLVSPGFVNIHTHLDKADLLSQMKPGDFGKTLEENRELLKKFKREYTVENVKERAGRVVREFVSQGVTAIRTQVDVDATGGLTPLKALLELKKELSGFVTLQICAFPQQGVVNKDSRALVEEALKSGADMLGGLPLVEKTRDEQEEHIDILFSIARKYNKDLEVQVDEINNPQDFMLPILAEKTIENKWQGRVSATHCISLSAIEDKIALEAIRLVKEARMNVIVTPSANLITRFNIPDDVHSRPNNSITRVKELLEAGVNVAMGTDNIRDIFYPLGDCSMLREMHVLAAATRMTRASDPETLFRMATVNGAGIMGLKYGVKEGCAADLVVMNHANERDTINGFPHVRCVIKGGRIVAENALSNKSYGGKVD